MSDATTLPFDLHAMLARLRPWVECESPTYDREAVNRMMALVARDARAMGAGVEVIANPGRYAIARFDLETRGVPSHAGWALKEGRSAIAEMARRIIEVEALTGEDCTFSVGVIHAGQWVNCVASSCRAEVLSMAKRPPDLDGGVAALMAMAGTRNGVEFIVTRGVTRPVWPPEQPGTMRLYQLARDIGARMGVDLGQRNSGGGSDGNFTGALGIATLDGLGLRGAGLHTLDEHVEIDSLIERAKLATALFMEIGA